MKTLLIDGDILVFKFSFRHQTTIHWGNGAETEILEADKAIQDLDDFIDSLMAKLKCVEYQLCFTNRVNFRYALLPSYKHNRVNMEPPKMLRIVKDHARQHHPWISWEYCEADDVMGILGSQQPDKYILATTDKDFKSLPVHLYNWDKDEKPRLISEQEADFWFHYQWLIGDRGDGYEGCYRIGDKTARKILESAPPEEWTECVIGTYATNKYRTYSWNEIITQARMARILRHTDWDFKRKEPILYDCH